MLRYHWSKLPQEARQELANAAGDDEVDIQTRMALERFYAEYGLPEFRLRQPVHPLARQDLQAALDAGRVPNWVLALSADVLA